MVRKKLVVVVVVVVVVEGDEIVVICQQKKKDKHACTCKTIRKRKKTWPGNHSIRYLSQEKR
jgi:hypothetical protein